VMNKRHEGNYYAFPLNFSRCSESWMFSIYSQCCKNWRQLIAGVKEALLKDAGTIVSITNIPETSEDISPYATFQLSGPAGDPHNTLLHSFMYHEQAMTEGCASPPPPAGVSMNHLIWTIFLHNTKINTRLAGTTVCFYFSHALAQAVSYEPSNPEAGVQSQASSCSIYSRQSGTGTGFLASISAFPCQYHSTNVS
jgi:hypothetical protein